VDTTVIGVAVVEDHPLSRQSLRQIITRSSEVELITTVSSVGEMEDSGYDGIHVVLLDFHLPDAQGADAVSRVKTHVPAVLVISASNDHQSILEAIGAGANGYLSKGARPDEILKAVSAVSQGGAYVSPMLAAHLLRDAREATESSEYGLSDQERQILALVAQGETETVTARNVSIPMGTLNVYLDRIREKVERRHRAELTRYPHDTFFRDS
jgi:DNA-binding NarL/FixJ family response regulator